MEHTHSQSFAISNRYCKSVHFNLNILLIMKMISSGFSILLLKCVKYVYNATVPGNRNNSNGTLNNVGSNGNYWSSTVSGTNASNRNFNSGGTNTNNNNRANGLTVRCLKD